MKVVFLAVLLAFAAATPWFAQYDLPEDQIPKLTADGCFRGLYGGVAQNGDPRTMSLLTCRIDGSEPFADMAENATLCVVELFSPDKMEEARQIILAHPLSAMILFVGRQELVIANPLGPSASNLCCPVHFPSVAANVLYVPERPISPQMGYEMDHPAVQRYLNGTMMAPNPIIQGLISSISKSNIQQQVKNLATDKNGLNTGITRNSYSIGAKCTLGKCINDALDYVESTVKTLLTGRAGVTYTRYSFQSDMATNLVVRIPGKLPDLVIAGSHLDSRNNIQTNTANAAPGADDNASGSGVNLEFIRVLAKTYFEYTLEFQWYVGEEQGLLGSKKIAADYKAAGTKVLAQFNTDMIGYTSSTYGITMSFMTGSATSTLTSWCREQVGVYVPTLKTATTSACCSDQQSWYQNGFPAIGIFETPTSSVAYPQYHTAQDTIDLVNYEQLYQFAQGMMGCIAEYAIPVKAL